MEGGNKRSEGVGGGRKRKKREGIDRGREGGKKEMEEERKQMDGGREGLFTHTPLF